MIGFDKNFIEKKYNYTEIIVTLEQKTNEIIDTINSLKYNKLNNDLNEINYLLDFYINGVGIDDKINQQLCLSEKPKLPKIGQKYFDLILKKPLWWNGENWIDGGGNIIA